jgi:hypothetical protein
MNLIHLIFISLLSFAYLNRLMIFSILDNPTWNISSSGADRNMESSYFCICCLGDLNGLNTFKVKGQGHGESDISFLIILHISTCGTYTNLPSSIFMFWVDEHSNKSQFRGQMSRSWRNWYVVFDKIAISICGTDTCRNVQAQYLCLGSWRFQRDKYFQGQTKFKVMVKLICDITD